MQDAKRALAEGRRVFLCRGPAMYDQAIAMGTAGLTGPSSVIESLENLGWHLGSDVMGSARRTAGRGIFPIPARHRNAARITFPSGSSREERRQHRHGQPGVAGEPAPAVMGYNPIADVPSLNGVEVIDMRRYNIPLDVDDLVRRYTGGESEKALAKSLGVTRKSSAGDCSRPGSSPGTEREHVPPHGSDSPRGTRPARQRRPRRRARPSVPPEPETRRTAATGRPGLTGRTVSPAEIMLAGMLRDAGLDVIHQKAIGPYNVDLAAGSVAVEVFGGGWHRRQAEGERLRYILDAGGMLSTSGLTAGVPTRARCCSVRDRPLRVPRSGTQPRRVATG